MGPRYQTSPFFRGGWFQREDDSRFVGKLTGSEATIQSGEIVKLFCLYSASEPKTREKIIATVTNRMGVEEEIVNADFEWLLNHGFLIQEDAYDDAIDQWIDNGWRFALYYHEYLSRAHLEGGVSPNSVDENETCMVGTTSDRRATKDLIELPAPPSFPNRSIDEILYERETCREFSGDSVSIEELSAILKYGVLGDAGLNSIIAQRSLDLNIYPFVSRTEELSPGIYRYVPNDHGIVPLEQAYRSKEIDQLITNLIVDQSHAEGAGVSLFITISFRSACNETPHSNELRTAYVLLSQVAQMALLVATAFGLDTFQTAAFEDSSVASLLQSNKLVEEPGYVLTFGHSDTTNDD